ncbi:MAG: hypothetical protein ABFD89_16870 [Bryobacteraceae bacterium]
MAKLHLEIKGLPEARRRIRGYTDEVRRAVAAVLEQTAEKIMADSKEIVPVDTGTLMSTGQVAPAVDRRSGEIVVSLGYGGPACKYAVAVHENLSPGVNWKRPGSGPKYLETPFMQHAPKIPERIKDAVRRIR